MPECEATDVDGGEERGTLFGVSRGDAPPPFQMHECVFNAMAKPVEIRAVRSLYLSVFLWWNDGFHALGFGLFENRIGIVAPICQQIISCYAFDQVASLRAICRGILCNKDSDRQTRRIHGQMYLGIDPPFVRLMA